MKRSFPAVFDVGFTAQMENELDKVEEGDLGWQQVLGDFWGPFSKALDAVDVQQLIHDVHDLSELHKEKCPTCGSGLVVKSGRDRKSTRLNSSHLVISYAVFCLKK